VCDLETSRMGAPYIYDISRLRVKDLHSATYIYVVRRLRVNWPYSFTHSLKYDLHALYVEINIQAKKAFGTVFRRSTTMYTRHVRLLIKKVNCPECI